jgi:hypothetical protein
MSATAPNSRVAGRYRVGEELGSGGMATVYRAEDRATGRRVALKQLRSSFAGTKRRTMEALFEREYHTLVRLQHRRIVEVYDYGFTEAGPYYTMELLDAGDLQRLAPLHYREVCQHLCDVASSLALIHAHRWVHRDVSPRNVRLSSDGRAKLIDFGALTSFGPNQEIIGTVPCMSPELVRCMPLDQRADLYSLGAVGYFALTGRHAYAARNIQGLPAAWLIAPPRPSTLVADIPPELDALIMSLLSSDPLARPENSALVIDQLSAIAGLQPEEFEHAAESYLRSGQLVGRRSELQWMRRRVLRATQGRGSTLVVEGPLGSGKTRLLHELGLEAQLRGAVLVKCDAQGNAAPFGVAAALAINMLWTCPELADRLDHTQAALIAHLHQRLPSLLSVPLQAALAPDALERRSRLQTALYDWFVGVARERLLVVAVDNVQAADDNSSAFLAALSHETRHAQLILLVTQRDGDNVIAPAALKALRKHSSLLRVANLSRESCATLVASLFGDVANVGRVGQLLYDRSAGNPQHCMDLSHLLVKRGIARYVGGTWVLPLEVSDAELPSRLEELLADRLRGLSAPALTLAEALSIFAEPVPLERALALAVAEGYAEQTGHAALDELLDEQILRLQDGEYRFAQESLRLVVFSGMDDVRRRQRQMNTAELLLAGHAPGVTERVEAAWHMLRAGEETRGADLLAAVGRELLTQPVWLDSHEQVVEALIAALHVFEKQKRSDYERASLMFPLLSLGFLADWRIGVEYGERAVQLGLSLSGLRVADQLSARLGRRLALTVGLASGSVNLARARKRARLGDLQAFISEFCATVPPTLGALTICYDTAAAERLVELLRPLTLFGPEHITTLMYEFGLGQVRMVQGRELEARLMFERIRVRFEDPAIRELLGEVHWKALKGGILFCLAILSSLEFGPGTLAIAQEMQQLDVRLWTMGADQSRVLYHAMRGETEQAKQCLARVELFAIQGGSTWQAEMFWPFMLLVSYVETGDTIAARRAYEQLERRAKDAPSLHAYAECALAAYLTLRGDLHAAIAVYERNMPRFEPRKRAAWPMIRTWFADALISAGQSERAKQLLLETLACLGPEQPFIARQQFQVKRMLARAEIALGNHAPALAILEGLLREHREVDQPLLIGLLHKTRLELALAMNDADAVAEHLPELGRHFRATHNPALFGQWERMVEKAARAGFGSISESIAPARSTPSTSFDAASVSRGLSELTLSSDRYEFVLQTILHRAGAKSGYLYVVDRDQLQLVAAHPVGEPSPELTEQLRLQTVRAQVAGRELQQLRAEEQRTVMERGLRRLLPAANDSPPRLSDQFTQLGSAARQSHERALQDLAIIGSLAPEAPPPTHRFVLLQTDRENAPVVVGGAILDAAKANNLDELDDEFIDAVSAALGECSTLNGLLSS